MVMVSEGAPASAEDPPPPAGITIMELTDTTCRWPLWATGERPGIAGRYCGERCAERDGALTSFCEEHANKAWPK